MLAEINGVRLAYTDSGEGTPIFLLVHGFALSRAMWDPQLNVLRGRGRVIAVDLRGFGASEAGPPGPLTMDQHADDLAALLDHLEIQRPVIFCGMSMGGYVAFSFWRRHQARLQAFILADTRATPDTPEGREVRLATAQQVEAEDSSKPAIDLMWPNLFARSQPDNGWVVREVLAIMGGTSPRGAADGHRGMAVRPDSVPLLPDIYVPTLVIVGEDDRLTPPNESVLMAERLPRARLEKIALAGHMANMENPDPFNQSILDWLDSLPESAS